MRGDARLHRLVVERIHQLLVVEPPRELRRVERIADRVALPRIGLVHRDRLVDLVHPARLVGRDQGMRQQPPRAREAVDQRARLGHLRVGQEPPGRIVERRAAQQGQAGVAVVEDLLDVVLELVAGERGDALRLQLRVPVLARELGQAQKLLVVEVVAHEVGLHVEDELAGQALRARLRQLGLARLGRRHLEDVAAVDLVHGNEGRRHAATRAQELPAIEAEPLGIRIGELDDPPLDFLLGGALPWRQILAVGDDLGRDRRCRRGFLGPRDEALFAFTEPITHRFPPSCWTT